MALMLVPALLLGILITPASSICVDAPPLEFEEDVAAGDGGEICDGFLQTNNGIDVCGHISSAAAERACWELQLNQKDYHGLRIKNYRCNAGVSDAAVVGGGTDEQWVIGRGQINWDCPNGSPDCFLDCHTGPDSLVASVGLETVADCIDAFRTAIDCTDINECKEGVIHDCVSGFDHECMRGLACGNNTLCTNTPGEWECECLDGFDGDPYNISCGCQDINECLILPSPCVAPTEQCHNTIGGFVCECPPGTKWNDDTNMCDDIPCPALDDIPNAAKSDSEAGNGVDTFTCEAGYETSYSEDYGIHIECRGHDYCHCRSASCVRKSCGVPPMDPNAATIKNDALYKDVLAYTCHPGFESHYTITCQDGEWQDPGDRCENINECLPTNDCPVDSDCIDTIGSYHCDCHPGYEGPTCKRISCGKIPEVDNAQRVTHITEEDSVYEMTVVYECEEGFRASNANDPTNYEDSFTITCKLDKTWDHRPIPECVPIFCGDPGTVAYSTRYGDSFYYWEQVTYTCHKGFRPSTQTHSDDRQFRVRCEYNQGWDGRMTCDNVNECDVLSQPCGVGYGHHCIDTVGSYKCSCAPNYRIDHTGTNCVPFSPKVIYEASEPCELYIALGFCHQGNCYVDDRNTPRCRCKDGYGGTFCNEDDRINLTIPYIVTLLTLSVIGFCIIILIMLSCYVCAKHYHDSDCPPTPPPVYEHTPAPKVLPVPVPVPTPVPQCPPVVPKCDLPVHQHKPPQQNYEVRYIARQVPVNGANQAVAAAPQGGVYLQ